MPNSRIIDLTTVHFTSAKLNGSPILKYYFNVEEVLRETNSAKKCSTNMGKLILIYQSLRENTIGTNVELMIVAERILEKLTTSISAIQFKVKFQKFTFIVHSRNNIAKLQKEYEKSLTK